MKLSIITVNLNNREGLKKTLDSVAAQTWRDFDHIIIDGASTDGSVDVIREYAERNNTSNITKGENTCPGQIHWISEKDTGIYNAMNKGIRMAKGEYCLFLNSGDWLYGPSVLLTTISKESSVDFLCCNTYDKNGQVLIPPRRLDILFFYQDTLNHQSTFIKRTLFEQELYNEQYGFVSDWVFFMNMILYKEKSYAFNDSVLTGAQPGESYSIEKSKQERKNVLNKRFCASELELFEKCISDRNNYLYNNLDKIHDCGLIRKQLTLLKMLKILR